MTADGVAIVALAAVVPVTLSPTYPITSVTEVMEASYVQFVNRFTVTPVELLAHPITFPMYTPLLVIWTSAEQLVIDEPLACRLFKPISPPTFASVLVAEIWLS